MRFVRSSLPALFLLGPLSLSAAASSLFGDWKTADGSVVRTFPCSNALCMKIVTITPKAPGTLDRNNPNASLRQRSLCNLEIGTGFNMSGDTAATGGQLYDPESGRTYKGNINLVGDTLKLRGYLGIALFGRTEIWHRAGSVKSCS